MQKQQNSESELCTNKRYGFNLATIWHENSLGILATHSHYRNRKSGICEELFIFIKSENSFLTCQIDFISNDVPTHQINFIKVDSIMSLVSKVWVSMFLCQRTPQISEINFKMKLIFTKLIWWVGTSFCKCSLPKSPA